MSDAWTSALFGSVFVTQATGVRPQHQQGRHLHCELFPMLADPRGPEPLPFSVCDSLPEEWVCCFYFWRGSIMMVTLSCVVTVWSHFQGGPESVGSPMGWVVSRLPPNPLLSFLVGRKREGHKCPDFLKGKFLVLFGFEAFEVSWNPRSV